MLQEGERTEVFKNATPFAKTVRGGTCVTMPVDALTLASCHTKIERLIGGTLKMLDITKAKHVTCRGLVVPLASQKSRAVAYCSA